jgi:hypothetical protein
MTIETTLHPMMKMQSRVKSLVDSNILKPEDSLWKIAFLFNDEWAHWKQELLDFGFSLQDSINDLILVESWEDN